MARRRGGESRINFKGRSLNLVSLSHLGRRSGCALAHADGRTSRWRVASNPAQRAVKRPDRVSFLRLHSRQETKRQCSRARTCRCKLSMDSIIRCSEMRPILSSCPRLQPTHLFPRSMQLALQFRAPDSERSTGSSFHSIQLVSRAESGGFTVKDEHERIGHSTLSCICILVVCFDYQQIR